MGTNEVSEACSIQNNSFNASGDRMIVIFLRFSKAAWSSAAALIRALGRDLLEDNRRMRTAIIISVTLAVIASGAVSSTGAACRVALRPTT